MFFNQKGSALAMGVFFVAAVGAGTLIVMKRSQSVTEKANSGVRFLKGKVETKKVFSVAGYLITNNLIGCKHEPFEGDTAEDKCIWIGKSREGEEEYNPSDFQLKNPKYDSDDNLVFELVPEESSSEDDANLTINDRNLSRYKGTVSFKLVDTREEEGLMDIIGQVDETVAALDSDPYVIKTTVAIDVPSSTGEPQKITAASIFKRPLAVPKVDFKPASCSEQCMTFTGEHTSPACRGPGTIAGDGYTNVEATVKNQGPGIIYGLAYERMIKFRKVGPETTTTFTESPFPSIWSGGSFSNDLGTETIITTYMEPEEDVPPSRLDIPVNNYLLAGQTINFTDRASCAQFVKNITNNRQVMQMNVDQDGRFTGWSTGTEVTSVTQTLDQHNEPSGIISYILKKNNGDEVQLSNIEPFRLMQTNTQEDGDTAGVLKTTETNVTVYVVPSH